MSMKDRTAVPGPVWGWGRGVTLVEVERVSKRGAQYAVDRVYLNGEHQSVGFVVGRVPTVGKAREWDKVVTDSGSFALRDTDRLVYPTSKRQHALTALVEATRDLSGKPVR